MATHESIDTINRVEAVKGFVLSVLFVSFFSMHSMMTNTGFYSNMNVLWSIHMLSVVIFLAGFVLLIVWAIKTLTPADLKMKGLILAGIGTILCLLTIAARGSTWSDIGATSCMGGKMMPMQMMKMMDEDMDEMMHDMDEDPMSMSMHDMQSMLKNKTGDEFDQAFIEGMIPHHQGAIDMARAAQTSAKHEEIKAMAEDIISAQQREIDMMKQWQQSWGYSQ